MSYSKYRAKKVYAEGMVFDSGAEYRRYCQLKLLQQAGEISNLRTQVYYKLIVNDILICKYKADAVYTENGVEIVEDTKGVRTKEFSIKAKLFFALHGIKIREIDAKSV